MKYYIYIKDYNFPIGGYYYVNTKISIGGYRNIRLCEDNNIKYTCNKISNIKYLLSIFTKEYFRYQIQIKIYE